MRPQDDYDSDESDLNNSNDHPFKKSGILLTISDFVVPDNAEYITNLSQGS